MTTDALSLLGWILASTAVGSIVSAAGAAAFLAVPERLCLKILPHLVSFATGALLGAALLALLPEAIEAAGPGSGRSIGFALLAGFGLFFVIEKLVLWKHAHSHEGEDHLPHAGHDSSHEAHGHRGHGHSHGKPGHVHARDRAAGALVLVGDSVHNALDGLLIGAAFLTDVSLGLVTTLAVAAHEVPHRVGDFVILVHSGLSRGRALALNLATGLAAVAGGLLAWFGLRGASGVLPYALALAAAGFLYIAVAGLIPGLHRRADPRTSILQVLLIGAGVGLIATAEALAHG